MADISYDDLWRSELYNSVCEKNRVQDNNLNRFKLKVNDNYKKDEKITMNFEPHNNEDVVNEACLNTEISKIGGHLSTIEKTVL